MFLIFGLVFVGAFLLQGLFGFIQIKNFSKNFSEVAKTGCRVVIGKNPKKFRAGSLILIAIDEAGKIKETRIMKGVTIFAKFKSLPTLNNKFLPEVAANYVTLRQFNPLVRQCILNAYANYINFKTHNLDQSAYDTSVNFFSLPIVTKLRTWGLNLSNKFQGLKKIK